MLREATTADADVIQALMRSVPGFWDEGWRHDVLERALVLSGTVALVHLDGERIDGFACAHDLGFRAYLSEPVVSPEARQLGVGARLLAEVERRLAARGCSLVIADVWRDAEGFYRAQGWVPPAAVLLRKHLAAR